MRCLGGVLVAAGLAILAGLAAILLGIPPVAATTPHWAATEWVLSTTMENAVRRQAEDVAVPGDLDDVARVRAGASAYDAMCAMCHGAPGAQAGVVAEGLLPRPPELAEEASEWSAAELFWITRHGVRMTGMPAFGPTHDDREIWDVVAFLRRLPGLSPSAYETLVARGAAEGGHAHDHGDHGGSRHGAGAGSHPH